MREIKFRVWDLDGGVMFDWENCRDTQLLNDAFDGRRAVAMQFTGLKDKTGREIYEGDLIQYNCRSSYDGVNFEVKWSEDTWGWVLASKTGDYLANEYTPEGNRYKFIEVVGNILT